MTQLGADPDHLRGLARSLRAAAGRLDSLSLELARHLRATDWRGPDATSFTRQWESAHRPALAAAAGALSEVARRSEHHATQQEQASVGAARPRTEPVLTPLPRREERFLGAIDVRVGPGVGTLTGELTVAHLEGDRRRVVLTQSGAAGAMLGAGNSVGVAVGGPAGAGGAGSGGSADGRVTAGAVLRRSWELPADRVEDLLARLALEQLALGTVRVPDPLTRAGWLADEVIERLTGDESALELVAAMSAGVPTPASTEQLAEVEFAGAATLGSGSLLGGRAAGVTGLRVGRGNSSGGSGGAPSWIVEYRGASTGALTGRLLRQLGISLPPDAHRSLSVRIEVPDPPGDAAPSTVLVRVGTVTDTTTRDLVALVELDDTDTPSQVALGGAVAELRRGDPGAALGHLAGLAPRPEHVTLAAEHGVISGHTARAGATAGAGIGAGITVRGHVLQVDRPG